jgi:hypothetical protein
LKPFPAYLILTVVLMTGAAEADDLRRATIAGEGRLSCGAWTEARRIQVNNADAAWGYEQWVLGFLSGVAPDLSGPTRDFDPLNGLDVPGVLGWFDQYCRDHPLEVLYLAARAFVLVHPR